MFVSRLVLVMGSADRGGACSAVSRDFGYDAGADQPLDE